ncbi:pyruvate kinase [Terricaulis sp.]|uniref:pyruvate kinase n=1 Tax=Terricaulis sp. TaxID=2768686 RepID=UPI0037837269
MRARDCKIVATMGPASDGPDRLAMLIQAGVDCFRLNFSHGVQADQAKRMAAIRAAEEKAGAPVGVIADLQGPKIRVGTFKNGEITLRFNEVVTLEASKEPGDETIIRLPHPELVHVLEEGDVLKLDDGKMQLTVIERHRTQVKARVDFGGVLKSQKGLNVPTRRIPISALTEKDRDDLAFALGIGVDYIALSFVQHPDDVREAKALIGDKAGVIAKIEKPSALEEIAQIVEVADAVMVARGDLGVELPPEMVPIAQRRIIRVARAAGRPVIVATHMLESMVDAPTPTRAEASDVATAVYQGADAVMLSAESAVGRHPQSAVAIMDRIIRAVEADEDYWLGLPRDMTPPQATTADAIALSARHIADTIGCAAIVAYTSTGSTAYRVARERPRCGVVGLTPIIATARRLTLAWGVRAVVAEDAHNVEDMVEKANTAVRALGVADLDDRVAVIAGIPFGRAGKTNTIRVFRVE